MTRLGLHIILQGEDAELDRLLSSLKTAEEIGTWGKIAVGEPIWHDLHWNQNE